MTYFQLHQAIAAEFNQDDDSIRLGETDLNIRNYWFTSDNWKVLSNTPHNPVGKRIESQAATDSILQADQQIEANRTFRYTLFKPDQEASIKNLIILFHGLNEKYWQKYLAWAGRLVRQTGQSVILFPIAFHMNRSPTSWSKPRPMKRISMQREQEHSAISEASFANAAILKIMS